MIDLKYRFSPCVPNGLNIIQVNNCKDLDAIINNSLTPKEIEIVVIPNKLSLIESIYQKSVYDKVLATAQCLSKDGHNVTITQIYTLNDFYHTVDHRHSGDMPVLNDEIGTYRIPRFELVAKDLKAFLDDMSDISNIIFEWPRHTVSFRVTAKVDFFAKLDTFSPFKIVNSLNELRTLVTFSTVHAQLLHGSVIYAAMDKHNLAWQFKTRALVVDNVDKYKKLLNLDAFPSNMWNTILPWGIWHKG